MIIRPATSQDVPFILVIQLKNPPAAQWQASEYARLIEDPDVELLVAEGPEGSVLGFAAAQRAADEAELQNLAVDPEHQRQGIGQALLEGVHGRLRATGTKRVYLEVRPSNRPAVALYVSSGYTLAGRRQGYYEAPREDALLFSRALDSR